MTLNQSALIELLKELELTDTTERIRLLTQRAFQELINAEAETVIGAAPYERSENRATQRNGTRPRTLSTTAGDLDLKIPKLVLPLTAGASPPCGPGPICGRDGSVRAGRVDSESR